MASVFRYLGLTLALAVLAAFPARAQLSVLAFAPGDLLVSLETGPVLWRLPDGTPRGVLIPTIPGTGEGLDFDRSGNLFVARWCTDSSCSTGNTVEKYNSNGFSEGAVGSGYCAPHAIVFDRAGPRIGTTYVGQAGCGGSILRFDPGATSPSAEFPVAPDNYGAFWIDLAPDSCTMFYTSFGPNVKRFNVCTGTQLSDFNAAPLPGGMGQDVRALPDGGVLVSSGDVVARLNSSGVLVRTYAVPGEGGALWAGLDLAANGTFWVGNYFSSNVYKFDLATGAVLTGFNTGTAANTVVGIRVRK